VPEIASSFLTPWATFYNMTGESAAALTGLMFVVITIVSGDGNRRRNPAGVSTFSTPTVVHFSVALLISALLCAPWPSLAGPGIVLALTALAGLGYLVRIMLMTAKLREYHPDLEDWVFYTVLPFVSYGAILIGAIMLFRMPQAALFVLAGSVVLKLFIGIRNSWDVVTYLATGAGDEPPEST
jgi:hypothetical protein